MTVRMVASDLDGTLLRSDGTVSDRTRAALRNAEDAGLVVAFVTGRPMRWLDAVVETTGHIGVAVGANGAVIYDMETEQVLKAHTLPSDELAQICADLRSALPDVSFGVERLDGFGAEPEYIHDWLINPRYDRRGLDIPEPLIGPLERILDAPAIKLLAKDTAIQPDIMLEKVLGVIGDRATVTHSSSVGLVEIAAPGVTKATGLAEIAGTHGFGAADVVAVGDMPNDIPMLEWAGRSYAVANAHPLAKAAAHEVIGSNDDDAVAALIESLL
ncbi:MAG: HAD family hydrolase [Jatrophihabitans sp.]|uniref:HAD family hydrolase n=1 Tax=Jatrophihabitans sp. TaxID=1932789 RepID=UPI003F7D97B7